MATPLTYAEVIPTTRPGLIRLQTDVQMAGSPSDPPLAFEAIVSLPDGRFIFGMAFVLRDGELRIRTLHAEVTVPPDAILGFRWGKAVRRVALTDVPTH